MIRHAEPNDSTAIHRLIQHAIQGTSPTHSSWLTDRMASTTSLILVDVETDQVVGAIVGQIVLDEAEIHDVVIHDSFRQTGRATNLVQSFEKKAIDRGAGRFFLEVRADNTPARCLYEKAGYTITTRRTDYYPDGEDALMMTKTRKANE